MVARALAIVHTCVYDAWAAYDEHAMGTELGSKLRPPEAERNGREQERSDQLCSVSGAAGYCAGGQNIGYDPLIAALGYDPNDVSMDLTKPDDWQCGVRGSTQLPALGRIEPTQWICRLHGIHAGESPSTVPVNPATIVDANRWQPLEYVDSTGHFVTQAVRGSFLGERSSVLDDFGAAVSWGREPPRPGTGGDEGFLSRQARNS